MTRRASPPSVADERDGFAALLGAFGRQIERDAQAGALTAAMAEVVRRRIDTMIEQVALGLHLTAAIAGEQHVSRPHSGRGAG